VLTQYKAHSLIQHIQRGWSYLRGEFDEFVELLPAQQRIETSWYVGTADAVYQNIDILRSHKPEYVLILAGDHIYKMDYGPMIAQHVETNADLTVGCIEVPLEQAKSFGVMTVNDQGKILEFNEKPENPQPRPGSKDTALASMGIYVFDADFLIEQLLQDAANEFSHHDFGKDIIPAVLEKYNVISYPFVDVQTGAQSYWRDVGTVDAFWKANLELIDVTPELNLYDVHWPIWTYQEQLPPAKFVFEEKDRCGMAVDSMVSGGCIISGALVRNSLLFSNVRVQHYSKVESSVILPDVLINEKCKIKNAVIDRGCIIPEGTTIGYDLEADKKRYHVTPEGVVLVIPEMLGQQLHYIC
jgi:glucose-1-phosphate adenylyltransferase